MKTVESMKRTPTDPNAGDSDLDYNSAAVAAYLLGRSIAAERAVMTLISMQGQDPVAQQRKLQADLEFRPGMIAADLVRCGLDASLQPLVQASFQAEAQALMRVYAKNGLQSEGDGFPAFPASLCLRSPVV